MRVRAHEGHPAVHAHAHGAAHDHGAGGAHAPAEEHAPAGGTAPVSAAGGGEGPRPWKSLTPWLLFLVFVLGPCEPLIPLFFASALAGAWHEVALVVLGYAVATLAAMHALVALFWFGLRKVDLGPFERWTHAAAGGVIALAGAAMVFLGL